MTDKIPHADVLDRLSEQRTADDVVVATMTAGMAWPYHSKQKMDFGFMAPMGMASPMGLGIALARPDLGVIVLDADGSLLMNLGTLVTIGGAKPSRFLHVVFENGVYDVTAGLPLPGVGTASIPEFAASLGYSRTLRSADLADLDQAVADMHAGAGPILLAIPVTRDFVMDNLGRDTATPQALDRLGSRGFQHLRDAISAHETST